MSILDDLTGSQREAAARLASGETHNPIVRFVAGLPQLPSPRPRQYRPASPQRPTQQSLQDKLLARIKTIEETGYGHPGGNMLPAAALRPEVAKLFAGAGGVSGIDVSNMTPEEQRGLRLFLSPQWVMAQNNPGQTLTPEQRIAAQQGRLK